MSKRDYGRAMFWRALSVRDQTSTKGREIGESVLFSLPRLRPLRRMDEPLTVPEEDALLAFYLETASEASEVAAGRKSAPPGSVVHSLVEWGLRWKLIEAWCFFGVLIVRDALTPLGGPTPWTEACERGFDTQTEIHAVYKSLFRLQQTQSEADLPPIARFGRLHGQSVILNERYGGLLLSTKFCPIGVSWEDHEETLRARFNSHLDILKAEHRARVPREPRRTKEMNHALWLVRYHLEGEKMKDISDERPSAEKTTVSKGIHSFATLIGLPLSERRGRPKKNDN